MDEANKNIDQSWKARAEQEKNNAKQENAFVPPEPDFNFFITTLAIQASIALGASPNPSTGKTEEDITQAKFLIDTIGMLRDKTQGNLNEEEKKLVDNILYQLRLTYLDKTKGDRND